MLKSVIAVIAALLAMAVGSCFADADEDSSTTLKLRATLYMVALESDFPSARDSAFRTADGTVLHRASHKFIADAAIQGSAQLNDGRIVMYAGDDNGAIHWKVSRHPYAVGASGCPLLPFRSASVDKRVIPLGTKLIIPETRGMELPDGTVHDGVWYAVDTGGAIKRDRVDLFVGAGKAPLELAKRYGIGHLSKLDVKLAGHIPSCPA